MRDKSIILANGETTRVREGGQAHAPVVVLVHAMSNSIEIWDRVFPRLARNFRVIAFDLPGFGQASRPRADYDAAFFAQGVRSLLDALELERPILIGNSLGASAILHLGATWPDRVARAVLAAPGGFGRKTNLLMRLPALPLIGDFLGRPTPANNALTLRIAIHDPGNITPELSEIVDRYAALPGSDVSFVRTLRQGVTLMGSRGQKEAEQAARAFAAPALVVWGKQDRVFPVEYSRRAAGLLEQSELMLVDQCGHYPHWEQPEIFVQAVERFCQ